jgi:hypothetical protein
MKSELRDQSAYRIAIGALGLTVAVLFLGISWVAANNPLSVPVEFWFAAGALSGFFVGVLIPFSFRAWIWGSIIVVLALLVVCVWATLLAHSDDNSLPLFGIGAIAAGALLGLPIPSPAERIRRGKS